MRLKKAIIQVMKTKLLSFLLLFILGVGLLTSGQVLAQTDTASTGKDTLETKAMKTVFGEMKKIAAKEDSMLLSVLGITAVVSVVAVAMYLSFRKAPGEDPTKSKYNFTKRTTRRR
jgi:hypothetical protein